MSRPDLDKLRKRHDEILDAIERKLHELDRKRDGIELAEARMHEIREQRAAAHGAGDLELVELLDAQAAELHDKIAARRDERHTVAKRITALERREAIAEARLERAEIASLGEVRGLDGAAMPRGWKLILLDAREHGWTARVNSADRTAANCDRYSDKSSQAELFAAAQNGTGAPANPPCSYCSTCGSTHEYQSDGVAYPNVAKGAHLPWWGLGIDLQLGDEALAVLTRLGYRVRRPYMPREPWHLNLIGDPTPVLISRNRIQQRVPA